MNLNDFLQPSTLPAWMVSLPLVAAGLSVALPKIGKPAAIFTAAATSVLVVMLGGEVLLHGVIQMQVGGWPAHFALLSDCWRPITLLPSV